MSALPPGSTIGILGGGQLGRMLAGAAAKLGYDVCVLTPEHDSPAGRVVKHVVQGDYTDEVALSELMTLSDVITYEFENVPVQSAEFLLSKGALVRPGAKSLEMAQDRLTEKRFLQGIGIQTVDIAEIHGPGDIDAAIKSMNGAGILKRRRDGYDGKGQARLAEGDDYEAAWKALGQAPCILEAMAPFECEISGIVARTIDGQVAAFEPSENNHVSGILKSSIVPAEISDDVRKRAVAGATALAAALDHVGVLALEYFVLPGGELLANEYAPRVHNSGHWTPEACETGQFEQHIRAVAGLPLGAPTRHFAARMENLLGEEAIAAAGEPGVTLYGKREARSGRKMGHKVTVF